MGTFYNKCQIQTPISYVNQMLDQIGYQTDLLGKKVLENSFGRGNILCQIVYRYIQDGLKKNFSKEKIKEKYLQVNLIFPLFFLFFV